MRILADHTSLHTFRAGPHQNSVAAALPGMIQLFDYLLLSDEVWIADTRGTQTLPGTREMVDAMQEAGLALPTNSGLVRVASFSPAPLAEANRLAAADLSDWLLFNGPIVKLLPTLRERGMVESGPIAPAGVLPINFHEVVARVPRWDSASREEMYAQALIDDGINSTLAPMLVSEPLYMWVVECTRLVPEPLDPLYRHLTTLFRWAINRSLAASLVETATVVRSDPILYAPAHARAKALATTLPLRARTLYLLQEGLSDLYGQTRLHRQGDAMSWTATFPMPVFGAWLMLSLPRNSTLRDYLQRIAELRQEAEMCQFREWLAGVPPVAEVEYILKMVRNRLKLPRSAGASSKVVWSVSVPWGVSARLQSEQNLSIATLPLSRLVRLLRHAKRPATLLSGMIEQMIRERSMAEELLFRAQRLLGAPAVP